MIGAVEYTPIIVYIKKMSKKLIDFKKLLSYLEDAGVDTKPIKNDIISIVEKAYKEYLNVQDLSIILVGICFPKSYANTRNSFHWAENNNIDIQVAEMLGRSDYPVSWSEEEYTYY